MKKKIEKEKLIFIENVISILEKSDLGHEIKLIKRQDDVTKKYKRAQSSVRAFKDLFKDIDLYLEREDCYRNLRAVISELQSKDIVNMSLYYINFLLKNLQVEK